MPSQKELKLQFVAEVLEDESALENWEKRFNSGSTCEKWAEATAGAGILMPEVEVRRKRRTVRIGDKDVARGMSEAPEHGCDIVVADPTSTTYVARGKWVNAGYQNALLKRGLVFDNNEDAAALGKALADLVTGGGNE